MRAAAVILRPTDKRLAWKCRKSWPAPLRCRSSRVQFEFSYPYFKHTYGLMSSILEPKADKVYLMETKRERLLFAMNERGLGPSELARQLRAAGVKISPQSVHFWIEGKTKDFKNENLFATADILQFEPRWIVTGELPMRQRVPDPLREVILLYDVATKEGKTVIELAARTLLALTAEAVRQNHLNDEDSYGAGGSK